MTDKKRFTERESTKKTPLKGTKQINEPKSKKKRNKRRLFNTLRYQVGIPPTLSLILPSLLRANDELGHSDSPAINTAFVKGEQESEDLINNPMASSMSKDPSSPSVQVAESDKVTGVPEPALPSRHLSLHHYPVHAYSSHHLLDQFGAIPTHKDGDSESALSFVISSEKNEKLDAVKTFTHVNTAPDMAKQSQSLQEDGAIFHGKMAAKDVDQDPLTYSISHPIDGLTFHSDGSYTFDPSHASYQQLAKGDSEVVTTMVTVTDTAGGTHQEELRFTITGTNDLAQVTGQQSGVLKEDLNVDAAGLMHVHGQVDVVDVDKNESHTLPETIQGKYGVLNIDENGHWHYQVDNSLVAIQQLISGSALTDSIIIHTADRTPQKIDISIGGTDDTAVISGIDAGQVEEDLNVVNGSIKTSGDLSIVDNDKGQAHFITQVIVGKYGTMTIGENGHWQYEANNQQAAIQGLAKGTHLNETFTVSSVDGSQHNIDININGSNDLPVMAGQSQAVKEDGAVFHGQMVATDVDQDQLTYTTSNSIDGLTFNPDGTYTFDPSHASYQHLAKGDTQVVTTMVTVTDTAGGTHQEQLKFTITGTNDLPVMAGQSQSVKEDGAVLHGQMVATDVDQDQLTYTTSNSIAGLTFNPDGTYTFDPSHTLYQHLAKGDTQVVTTTVTVTDTAGGTHQEELKFTITGTNDLPVMAGQSQSLKEDGALFHGQMMATDVDQDLVTYTTSNSIDGLTFNPDGSYTFDPSHASYQHLAKGDTQVVTTTVTVTDTAGGTHQEELKFTITGTNDLPVMAGQSQSVKEDGAVFHGQMVATDVDQDQLTYTTSNSIDGLTFNPDGTYTFDPCHASYQHLAKGDTQVVTTTVTVTDTAGGTHKEELKFTITGTNDLPVMAGQSQSLKEDGAVFHGQMVATDVDQDLLTYSISHPIDGLTFNSDGSYTFNPSHSSYQHLSQGSTQQLSTTVTVTDSSGGSHQETLEMVVSGTNDRPIVSAWTQLQNGMEDKPVIIKASDLLTHGSDIDSADTLIVTHLQATNGVVVDNHDGTYTFTPNKDYNGEVRLTYRVEDNHGAFVETQARFNLAASPDNAVITDVQTNVDLRGVTEDRGYIDTHYMLHYDGQLNIQDPDVGEAQFDPNIGSQTYQGIGYDTKLGGHVLLMRDGRYTYTLDNRNIQNLAEGEVRHDFATIRSVDGTTHTMEFTVHGTNDAPTVAAQSHSVTEGGVILSGQMQGHDVDTGATLTYSTPNVDGLVFHSDGSYSFNPDHPTYQSLAAGVTKTLSIPVTVTDEHHASSTSVLTITVTGANNAAVVAGVDTGSVDEGAAGVNMSPDYAHSGMALLGRSTVGASGQLSIIDVDSGEAKFDTHGFGYTYAGKFGDLHLTEQGKWFYYADMGSVRSVGGLSTNRGTQIDQLGEGQTLTDTVTVYTKDGTPHDIVITIHGDNDRPYCSSEVTLKAGAEDTRQTITVGDLLANTVDVDANDAGQLTIENLHADHGSIQHNADGTFTFSPEKDYNGQVHFTYDVKDAHGGVTSTGASMTLAAVNDNPDTQPLTDSVTEDSTNHHLLDLLSGASDKEGDALSVQQLSFSVDGGPKSASLPDGVSLSPDGHTLVVDATHHAFQHLAAGHTQQVVMSYMVDDGHGGQTAQTATLSIQGSDDKATMVSHTIQLTESQALRSQYSTHHGNLQLTDPDTGDSTQFVFSGQYMGQGYAPGHLTVWPDGSYQFYLDPARNHHADDRIASLRSGETMEIPYQVETSDGQKLTIIVKVTGEDNQARIQVGPYSKFDNDAYEDKLAPGSTPNQVWSGGTLQVIDPDHDQAGFVAQRIDTPEGGHFSIDASGWWQYTIDNHKLQHLGAGQSYQKTFTVESIDGSAQRDITVTVHGRNDAPVVTSAVTIPAAKEDQTITLTVKQLLANATDVDDNDANQLTIDNLLADHGSITDNHDGTYTFTPDPDYNGQVQFTYDVKDAHGGSTTSGASLDLAAVNDASKLASGQDSANLTEDQVQSGTHQLETGWINLDVTDVDGATDADIAFIEVNGIKHAVPANFAMNLTANHGYFSTTHSTDGHNKWSYTADNDSPDIQGLKAGQQLQDSMVLITKDGTRIPVTATINGHDDHVIIDTPDKLTAAIGTAIEDTTTTVAGTLQAHDLDKGDQISFELATASQSQAGSYGTFYLDSTGHWRYDLDPAKADSLGSGEGKAEIFDIVAISSDGSRATQKVEVFVRGTNDAPVVSGSISLPSGEEDHSVTLHSRDLLANATDVDNYDRLSVTSLQADHGVVKDNHDGTYTFTPEPNYNGAVHFSYNVTDNHGASTPASASLTLAAVDDKTQFLGVNHGIAKEDIGTYDPLSNSSIKDSVNWQFLTITDIDSNNTQIEVEFAGKHYTWTLGQDLDVTTPYGKFQFHTITSGSHQGEHAWSYIGDNTNSDVQGLKAGESLHESIKLTAKDGTEFPIQVEVRGTEDGVIIDIKGELAHVTEDSQAGASVSGQLVAHDTDIHDQVHWTESPSSGVAGSYGTFHVDAAGHWHYVVDQSRATQLGVGDEKWEYFNVESVSSDGSRVTKRVAVVVHGQNDNPTVSADVTLTAGTEDTPIRLTSADLLANATHVDNNDRGWLRVANLSADHGTVTTNQDGTFTFTPNQDYNGVVQFSYDVIDRHGGSTSAHASVSLQAVNDLPAIHGDIAASVIEKGVDAQGGLVGVATAQGTLTTIDPDTGDSITWQVMSPSGTYGRLTIDQHGHWHYQLDDTNSAVQALPNGRTVQDSFVVTATDQSGTAVQQTVIIDVQGSNDGATIDGQSTSALSYDITEDSVSATLSGHLQLVDIDSGEDQFVPLNQVAGTYGHLTLNAQGDWTYVLDNQLATTNALHSGQVVTDHFTVTSPDGTATKSITVNVHGHDDLATLTVSEGDSQQSLDLLAGIQAQAIQHIQYSTDGIHFSSTLPTGFSLAADGHTLQVDASGGSYDHLSSGVKQSIFISYEMVEGTGLSAQVTQQHGLVEVIGTSDAPVLHSFSPRADQFSGPVTGNLLSGATDVDDGAHLVLSDIQYRDGTGYHTLYPGQSHSITGVGTISIEANGDYSFIPEPSFVGVVPAMWYRVVDTTDNHNVQSQSTLHISIDANHQPTVTSLSASLKEDTDLAISTSDFGYADSDSDALHSITITQAPDASHGHLILDGQVIADGTVIMASDLDRLIFRPVANYNGAATFGYTANDGHSDSTEQHAHLMVIPVNDAPAIQLTPLTPVTGTVTETDVDVGDTHQFAVTVPSGQYGTLTVDPATGAYQYVPNGQMMGMSYNKVTGHYTGQDMFEVSVTDKAGATSSLFVTFEVEGTVRAPAIAGQAPHIATHVTTQPTVSQTMPTGLMASHQQANHVTVDLVAGSDSGRSHSDDLTNDQTPTISGHTDIPFSKVNLYDGSRVVGSGYSDAHGNYQIDTSTLGDGLHNISARALAPASVIPVVSSLLPITIDTVDPIPSVSVDTVTRDNVINAAESQSTIAITGLSSGDVHQGDVVTIEVHGHTYSGAIDSTGRYSIDVPGAELEQVSQLKVSISATDSAGNTATTSIVHHYETDTSVGSPTIIFESPGSDNLYSKAEIAHGAAGTITATVHAATDAKVGEHLNINGVDHVLDLHALQHGIDVEVAPNSLVKAIMTDEHGNVNSALNMAAGAKPEPIVVTAPTGSHHISTSLGAPTLMPSLTPVPASQQGWKILVNGHYQTSVSSQWGTLSIDPRTGHLSYQEHADVHTGPHGSAQNVGVHEDHFQVALQGSHHDDVVLHVQVSILSHGPGHSGKLTLGSEVLDMTVTPVSSHVQPSPPPPPPSDAYDEPSADAPSDSQSELTIMVELGIEAKAADEADSHSQHSGASSYLEHLGIDHQPSLVDSKEHNTDLPDDIDIVLNDTKHHDGVGEHHSDTSHQDDHSSIEHLHDTDRDHRDLEDPTLPDDPTQ